MESGDLQMTYRNLPTRRDFTQLFSFPALTLPFFTGPLGAGTRFDSAKEKSLTRALTESRDRHKIPCVVAMVADRDQILYQGAFGTRDSESGKPVQMDSVFAIASMTKAITSAAAMHMVERGKLSFDQPAAKVLPELGKVQVLDGYDDAGKPKLRAPKTAVTLRHLLSHTSGFCYNTWSDEMVKWEKATGTTVTGVAPNVPLMFDPGARWQYGYGIDYAGKMVEAASGLTLEQYFQQNLLQPLGMRDTSFIVAPDKFERLVTGYGRQADGTLKSFPRELPKPPAVYNGGGGLFSAVPDYMKFTQMILRNGQGAGGASILKSSTVKIMSTNQTGAHPAGRLKSQQPERSSDVDLHPGADDRYTAGFLLNPVAHKGGRAAGSLGWAGIYNTFYWIDPKNDLCAVLMMQLLPFVDKEAVGLLSEFEQAVYA